MAKVVVTANQKGGVAKTTTTAAMAAGLKEKGYSVLAVDIDPQGNLSDSVGADNMNEPTVYEVLKNETDAKQAIQQLDAFDIIPANIMLAAAEQEISEIGKEQRLKEKLEPVMQEYDYIVIDTPPALGLLTINAFTAADEVIVPSTAGIFAATGIKQLYDTIQKVKKYCNPKIKIAGILMTKYNPRANNNKDMKELTEKLAEYMQVPVYNTFIRNSVVVEEAQSRKINLLDYKKNAAVSEDYLSFAEEYLKGEK